METFGQRLKAIRGTESQSAFAERVGLNVGTLRAYESDRNSPTIDKILEICSKLSIHPIQLIPEGAEHKGDKTNRSKMYSGAAFAGDTLGPSTDEELSYLRKEVRELRDENRDLRNENMELRKENRELRKVEAEYLRLRPDKDDQPEEESTRKSA